MWTTAAIINFCVSSPSTKLHFGCIAGLPLDTIVSTCLTLRELSLNSLIPEKMDPKVHYKPSHLTSPKKATHLFFKFPTFNLEPPATGALDLSFSTCTYADFPRKPVAWSVLDTFSSPIATSSIENLRISMKWTNLGLIHEEQLFAPDPITQWAYLDTLYLHGSFPPWPNLSLECALQMDANEGESSSLELISEQLQADVIRMFPSTSSSGTI
ncbi:hypothetical protein BDZ97DRAFT_2074150 [Flammula alnicola]|nr:hypothetical protein BDZ97DRAFT_2074150 [Flammula alnicola]